MFKFFPELYKDIEALLDNDSSYEKIVTTTAHANYFREEIEKDAREQSFNLFNECIEEIEALQLVGCDVLSRMKNCVASEIAIEKEIFRSLLPIMKSVDGAVFKLGHAKFADFGMQLYKGKVKGMRAYQEGKGNSLLKSSEDKTKLLKDIIKFYLSKKVGKYDEEKRLEDLEQLRSILVKNGILLERGFLFDIKLLSKMTDYDDYYEILKSEEVSKESFDLVQGITDSKVNDLIIFYLQKGQMVFVEEIISQIDAKTLRNFLFYSTSAYRKGVEKGEIFQNKEAEIIKEHNLLRELSNAYVVLMNKQKEGTLLYDEVDGFFVVLKKLCEKVDVNMEKDEAEGSPIKREMRLWLIDLYHKTEALAMKQVELIMGYCPTTDEFSLDNQEDRAKFLLKGKDRELWVKKVYGLSEYKRVVAEREANQEYIVEND